MHDNPDCPILGPNVPVQYLYTTGELEGGSNRNTNPVWSLTTHNICNVVHKSDKPSMYYLIGGPACGFVHEELLVVPVDIELPPKRIQ